MPARSRRSGSPYVRGARSRRAPRLNYGFLTELTTQLAELDRHVDLGVLALHEQRDVLAGFRHELAQLLGSFHRHVVDGQNDITRLDSRRRRSASGIFNDYAAG